MQHIGWWSQCCNKLNKTKCVWPNAVFCICGHAVVLSACIGNPDAWNFLTSIQHGNVKVVSLASSETSWTKASHNLQKRGVGEHLFWTSLRSYLSIRQASLCNQSLGVFPWIKDVYTSRVFLQSGSLYLIPGPLQEYLLYLKFWAEMAVL